MAEYDARKIGLEPRIYKSISGKKYDVTFTPYAANVLYDEYYQIQVESATVAGESQKLISDYRELTVKAAGLPAGDPGRAAADAKAKEIEEQTRHWIERKQRSQDLFWQIIMLTLEANGNPETLEDLQKKLTVQEVPRLLLYILGLDEDSKKNKKSKVKSS